MVSSIFSIVVTIRNHATPRVIPTAGYNDESVKCFKKMTRFVKLEICKKCRRFNLIATFLFSFYKSLLLANSVA